MKKIIFDCDNTMGVEGCDVDDGLALIYLLGKENIDICGITTTYGNSDIDTVYNNTTLMLRELGRSDISLLKGCVSRRDLKSEAVNFMVKMINLHKGNISILATGSLTNLYAAYLLDNSIFNKISEIVLMGGVTERLIINGRNLDELNFSCDPIATECVLNNGKNVAVITGNNCLNAYFSELDFKERLLSVDNAMAKYLSQKCMYWFKDMMSFFNINAFYNWDVVAAAFLANPSMFENKLFDLTPDIKHLERGFINDNLPINKSTCRINLPIIRDVKKFTDDIYKTWLNTKTPSHF
jgi:purine nucleosidase